MKILVSDIDGTLIHNDQLISQKNIDMMKQLQRESHLVVLCTGRSLKEFEVLKEQFHIPYDYVILNNGALIVDRNDCIIYEKVIPFMIGKGILDYIMQYTQLSILIGDSNHTYTYQNGNTLDYNTKDIVSQSFQSLYNHMNDFAIIAFHQADQGIQYSKQCYQEILKKYSDDIEAYFNTYFVDVVAKGCSKGNGIIELKKLLDCDGEVWAIGDSHNDLSMILNSDYGYSFPYGDIVDQVDDIVDYVYEMIEIMLKNNA